MTTKLIAVLKITFSLYKQASGQRYAIMGSNTQRFKGLKDDTPFAIYNIDTAHKAGIEKWAKSKFKSLLQWICIYLFSVNVYAFI